MALTAAQIRQHIGQMLDDVTAAPAVREHIPDQLWPVFVKMAKWYINNGAVGTQADRQEAMRTFVRALFQRLTGRDPATFAHEFTRHWCERQEPGSGSLFE